MKNWTIGRRITVGFTILVILTIVVGISGYIGLRTVNRESDSLLSDSMPGSLIIGIAKDNLSRQYANVERIMRAKTPSEVTTRKKEFTDLVESNAKLIEEYKKKIVTQEDQTALAGVGDTRKAFYSSVDTLFSMIGTASQDEVYTYIDGEFSTKYRAFRGDMQKLLDFNKNNSLMSGASVKSTMNVATKFILIVVLAALVLAIVIAVIIIKGTNKVLSAAITSIDEGSSQVAAAASQVSAASNMLAEGASEQAASLEETSSSLEEMASMTTQNAKSAQNAKALADEMHVAADSSAEQMKEMQHAMDAIKESSSGISQIIKTIEDIAFQTNILALNAAVEAARAGEAGAGFAVVAEEVRNLAQRSAESAKETSSKIEGAIKNSEHGVVISSRVADSLNEIVDKAKTMNTLVTEIASASHEQDKGIGQLTTAVQQMDKVTQSNASNAEETASASEELNAHADLLKDTVVDLVSLVDRDKSQASRTGRSSARVEVKGATIPVRHIAKVGAGTVKSKSIDKHFLPMNTGDKA